MVLDLAQRMPKDRFDVSLIATHGGGMLEKEFAAAGIPVTLLGTRTHMGFGMLLELARVLRRMKPDVVHTHLFAGDTWGRIATVLAFPFRRPVIISTEHNVNKDEGRLKRMIKWALQFVTDRIVTVSDAVREYSSQVDGIQSEKMTVIRHGVDVREELATPTAVGGPRDGGGIKNSAKGGSSFGGKELGTVVIGCVARLEPQKDHATLLHAFQEVLRLAQDKVPSELWLVGDGSLRKKLEAQAKELGIAEYVKFFGAHTDVSALLNDMDVVVLPSRWEGAGLVLLEAQAAGKPVVATRVGGVAEYMIGENLESRIQNLGVKSESTGMLVKPGDVDGLARALERFISDPELRHRMGKAGKHHVLSNFTMEHMIQKYLDLYTQLTTQKLPISNYQFPHTHLRDAVIAVTYLCQSRCNMCSIWKNTELPKLKPADMAALPTTLRHVNLSGGEPFLRPDLGEFVAGIRARCPKARIIISSNGFATDEIVGAMKHILTIDPSIGVAISIDGIGWMHDRVRGIPNGFRMCVATVRGLQNLGMKNLRIAFTAQEVNVAHLPLVASLADELGVEFTMSAVHNSSHYFQKEDNQHAHLEHYRAPFDAVTDGFLSSWSPKRWLRAYYTAALLTFLKTGRRVLPSYTGKGSFFLDPNQLVFASCVSGVRYGAVGEAGVRNSAKGGSSFGGKELGIMKNGEMSGRSVIEEMIAGAPEKTARAIKEQHWMICTGREAMRRHPVRVGWWILTNKLALHVRGMRYQVSRITGAERRSLSSVSHNT